MCRINIDRFCCICGAGISLKKRSDAIYCSNVCGSRSRNRRYSKRHPDRIQRNRLTQNARTAQRMFLRVKSRAKMLGQQFTIQVSDIVVPDVCPVLGIRLNHHARTSGMKDDSPSLDRIDPKKGYVPGNIRVISGRANLLKSNATVAEMELILADLKALDLI